MQANLSDLESKRKEAVKLEFEQWPNVTRFRNRKTAVRRAVVTAQLIFDKDQATCLKDLDNVGAMFGRYQMDFDTLDCKVRKGLRAYSWQDKKAHYTILFLVIRYQITSHFWFLKKQFFTLCTLSRTGTQRYHTDQSEKITSFGPFRIHYRHPPNHITLFVQTSIDPLADQESRAGSDSLVLLSLNAPFELVRLEALGFSTV